MSTRSACIAAKQTEPTSFFQTTPDYVCLGREILGAPA